MKRLPIVYDDRSSKSYWRSLNEQSNDPAHKASLAAEFPNGTAEMTSDEAEVSRRSFLTLMGASMALAGMTACRRPEEKILPYARPPEEMIPGKPLYFATAVTMYGTALGLLVESHEGRPTKIEGNPRHPESLGATTTHLQALVLDMYDPDRSTAPLEKGQKRTRDDVTKALRDLSAKLRADGGKSLAIVTTAHRSPTLDAALKDLKGQLGAARVVRYEPFDRTNGLEGTKLAFGQAVEPVYALEKAMVIATFDCDAFANEGSPLKNARGWVANRDPENGRPLNRMYAVESIHSVTGANADHRLRLRSTEVGQFVLALAQKLGVEGVAAAGPLPANAQKFLDVLAADLRANQGKSALLVGQRQPAAVHAVAALINNALGNVLGPVRYVRAFDETTPSGPKALVELTAAIASKQVDTVVILGGNPAFNAPADAAFATALAGAATSIHLSTHVDETSSACSWHIPRTHFLEAWDDAVAEDGTYSVVQPLIAPLYDGFSDAEIVRALIGDTRKPYELVRAGFSQAFGADEKAWKRVLHDGFVATSTWGSQAVAPNTGAVAAAAKSLALAGAGYEVTIHPDAHAYDGRFANNGWMQELPDAMTKITWGSTAWLSPATAKELNVAEGDFVSVAVDAGSVKLPVVIAPGQADKSIAIFLGQGRRSGRVATGVGVDNYPLFRSTSLFVATGNVANAHLVVDVPRTASIEKNVLSRTQEHFNMEGRPIVREVTTAQYTANPKVVKDMTPPGPALEALWYPHVSEGHKWGMTIDLNACIGCNACMVACQAENNVPVVGVMGVRKSREMHWLRIDRYFEGPVDDPRSVTMPMMCQQCENAPCESVCPVGATSHSPEGLNDMAYNRCIGTRYCANNCPYKVRRFNFFNYSKNFITTQQMQLNPNVSVRSRGVMEKCTWCVQRINEARISAKKTEPDGRVKDGTVVTACQQACPTRAIVFGDYNDRQSMVSQKAALPRAYALLAEFNFGPRLQYLGKVRNPNPELEPAAPTGSAHGGSAPAPGHAGQGAGATHPSSGGVGQPQQPVHVPPSDQNPAASAAAGEGAHK